MHRVAAEASDSAFARPVCKASRSQNALILICSQARRAIRPEPIRERVVTNFGLSPHWSVVVGEIIPGVVRIALCENLLDSIHRFGNSLPMTVAANHERPFRIKFLRVHNVFEGATSRVSQSPPGPEIGRAHV